MSNITSEKLRLAHLQLDLMQDAYIKETAIEFRKYLIELINLFASKNKRMVDRGYHISVTKLLSSIMREAERLNKEKTECEKNAHMARVALEAMLDYCEMCIYSSDFTTNLNNKFSMKIYERCECETRYYKQKSLCNDIEKTIAKLDNLQQRSPNKNFSGLLAQIVEYLKTQQIDENLKYDELKNQYEELDLKSDNDLDYLIFELRRMDLIKGKQRGKE